PNTVWTWNAIGKQAGAWGLAPDAPEATSGFLLNHLIAEYLPAVPGSSQRRITNSDPITGQAAWFDLRVRITKCTGADAGPHPTFEALPESGTPRPAVLRWCGDEARPRHRSRHLCGLPRVRDRLQGMERQLGNFRAFVR